jgi:DNA-binding winged helix-turn-helix (wHTH) protein/tetratricopeptide (TPR) repeat protein
VNEVVGNRSTQPDSAISLATRPDIFIDGVTIQPSLRQVEGPTKAAKGEPRVIQVLVALVEARGAVLSRDDLLRLCWDGRIVGDDAINRAIAEARRIAAAVGGTFEIETVPRVGYRITGVDWDARTPGFESDTGGGRMDRRKLIAAGVGGAAALAVGGVIGFNRREDAQIDALIERGRVLQGNGSPEGDRRAAAVFQNAIRRSPDRADAWGWLAAVLPAYEHSREAALRALDLDPKEPNARAVLAYQRRDLEAWTVWEDELLGVLADAPNNAFALNQLTFFYQGMGRCQESWDTNERACDIEPFNPGPQHRRALKHWIFGRVGDADKVADQTLQLWPRNPYAWNARMLIYACTERAAAALALLEDRVSRPVNLTKPSIDSWQAALNAIDTRAPGDIARAVEICTDAARLAPGLAAHAIMMFSHLGEIDAAFRVANGLLEAKGAVVQEARGAGIRDLYSGSAWGRTQFLFIPATASFRADARFPDMCSRIGHVDYWKRRGIWPDPFVRGAIDPALLT